MNMIKIWRKKFKKCKNWNDSWCSFYYIFGKVYSNQIFIWSEIRANLDIRYGLIKGCFSYKKYIEKTFLNENNFCKKYDTLNHTIEYFICDFNCKIKNFPKLIFQHRELKFNFELTYEDLFEKRNDGYYCKIVFNINDEEETFILGKPFSFRFSLYLCSFAREN